MRFNYPLIVGIIGLLLLLNGGFMLLCLPVAFLYGEDCWRALLMAAGVTAAVGGFMRWLTRAHDNRDLRKREGYLIVTAGWLAMTLAGSLPYVFNGTMSSYADVFFETMSGLTTTGATVLLDIEAVPRGILMWRSLTHWIGGLGIIVLAVAILPVLGIGGLQLFAAESSVPTTDKIHPRITETAKRLWYVYFGLTALQTVLLMLGGMTFFDAVNHAMSTLSTGGFSTKNASMAHYPSPYLQYVVVVFMFMAGANFTLTYFGFKGDFRRIWQHEEFRVYWQLVLVATLLTTATILVTTSTTPERALRDALFQVVAIVTTTGFVTADYTSWASFTTILFFILMFTGAMAGSTSGGIKVIRHIVLAKNSVLELKRLLHPSALIPVRFNKKAVSQTIAYNITAFILLYIILFFLGTLVMALVGLDMLSAMGAVAATLGGVGPGIGSVGPLDNFASIPAAGKWFLSFMMLLGRLELFTVLMLFTPHFWART